MKLKTILFRTLLFLSIGILYEINIFAQLTASISGNDTLCQNSPEPEVIFTGAYGEAPYTFTFKLNNNSEQTISTSDSDSIAKISVSTGVPGIFTYILVNVSDANTSVDLSDTVKIIINPVPDLPGANLIQPTCAVQYGAINISSPIGPSFEYSLNSVDWVSNRNFTSLVPDSIYTVYVRDIAIDPTCVSSADFTINAVPEAPESPEADITQPSCAEPTGTITITSPLGPSFEYSLNGTDWLSDPVFSGLTPDANYTIYIRDISVDPTCVSSAEFTINAVPDTPDTPEANITLPSCAEPTGTITITTPLGATIEYSLNGTDWLSDPVFSGLTSDANYTVYVRDISVDPTCVSSADFTIDAVPDTPDTPEADITQPSCAEPTGTITITTPLGATIEYSLNGTDWLSDPVFSGLTPDADYTVYVRDISVDPTCVSNADFTINPVPGAPETPEADIIQPSCAEPTGTITITTPLGSTIEYSLNGTDWLSDPVFSGLTPDADYTIYVRDTAVDPTCISSADFTIDPVPGAPDTPEADITQPSCAEPTGTITITAPLGATIEYSLNSVDWVSTNVFSGLTPDAVYTIYVRDISVDPTCVSNADFTVDPVPGAPDTPLADITQPSCAEPTGTITITMPLGATLEYSLNGTDWLSDPVFSGLTPDAVYTVYVRDISVDPTCVSSADFTIDPVPGAPDTPEADITQPSCAEPTGTITITSPLGPSLEYSLNGTDWLSAPVFSGLTPDADYTIYVRDISVDPTCVSSADFTIDAVPDTPDTPEADITQPSCAEPTGTITITSPIGTSLEYSLNGTDWLSDPVFSGLTPDADYTIYVRDISVDPTCVSSADFTIDPVPGAPDTPEADITQPSCAEPTGTITITSPLGPSLEYSLNGTDWLSDPVFTGLTPDAVYTVYVRDISVDPTCVSSADFTIDPVPVAPDTPEADITQPSCAEPTGTITITSPLGPSLEYSLNSVDWVSTNVFSGLTPDADYTVYVRDISVDPTCISSADFTIDPVPGAPDTPEADIIQPSCAEPTGTITITTPLGATIEYSLNGTDWLSDPVFSGLTPDAVYTIYVRDISVDPTCVSSADFTIDAVPGAPDTPEADITQPSCAEPTGTITITAPLGASIEYSLNGTDWLSAPVFSGLTPDAVYTVYVRDTSVDPTCVSSADFTIDPVPGAPDTPEADITQPSCAEPTGTITITSPLGPSLEYSLNGTDWLSDPVFSGLTPDAVYTIYVRDIAVDPTCVSSADFTIDPVPGAPETPEADIIQPSCAEPTGTITITMPLGATIEYSLNGTDWLSDPVFSGLTPDAVYTIYVRDISVDPTCVSSADFTINPVPGAPETPLADITQPTCAEPTGTITITTPLGSTIEYSLNGTDWLSDPVFSGLTPDADYTVYVRDNSVDPTCVSSADFTIDPVPGAPETPEADIIQPSCAEPTGTITITSPLGPSLEYSLNSVDWVSTNVFSGLTPDADYTVYVRDISVDPTCVSSADFTVDPVPDAPDTPEADITQPSCAEPTGTITITSPLGPSLEYSLNGTDWLSDPVFSGLTPDAVYTIYVRDISVDPTCVSSADFTIDPVPGAPETPLADITQPSCAEPTGTITITLPLGDAIEYSLNGTEWLSDPVFSGLTPDSNYTIYVRDISVDPTCVSSADFTIDPVPVVPDIPEADITQPSCAEPTGTITITSPLGSTLEYSLNGTDWLNDPVFSGLTPDADYTIYVRDTAVDPTCVSSADFTIDPVPDAPDTPEADITQPSCAEPTGTITITSPLGPSLEYSLNGTDWLSDPVFSGLTPDAVYTIYVRDISVDPTCVSSADFTIDPVPGAPETPLADITQPSCAEPTGTITITLPLGDAIEYSLNGTDWLSDPVFSGLTPDAVYTIYVRNISIDPTCVSSADFTIDPVPGAPDTPEADITQPSCAEPTGTITITSPLGSTLEYSLNGTDWLNDPVFSGLTPDAVYTIYVRDISVDPTCVSSADFTIDPVPGAPETPLADITQPSCAEPTGTITITLPLGDAIEYSLNGTDWLSAPVFSGLTPDAVYTIYVRNISIDPTCVSSADFTIDPVPGAPDTPEADITQPSCAEPTGTITITSPLGSTLEYSLNGIDWFSDPVFSGLTPDADYTVYVRDISVDPTCVSSADFTIDPVPVAPDTPEADIIQPSCAEPTGTITITSPLGPSLEYSLNGIDWFSDPVFSGLTPDADYTVYVRDISVDPTCVSSADFTVDPVPGAPDTPEADITQPSCAEPTGTITITSPLGPSLEYSLNSVDWVSTNVFSGLTPDADYTVYVRDISVDPTCVSSADFTIDPVPGAPETPEADITQPSCAEPTGTITITSPLGSTLEYSLNGTDWLNDPVFSGLTPDADYTIYVRDTAVDPTCVSSADFTIDPVPDAPDTPEADITQPSCAEPTGTITITTPLGATIEYSLNGTDWLSDPVFSGLTPDAVYTVYVRDNSVDPTCVSSADFTIDPVPGAPETPLADITQPSCAEPTGTITITSPLGSTLEYSLNGTDWLSAPVFSGLTPDADYTVYVRDISVDPTCVSSADFTIDPVPVAPDTPEADITQPSCAEPTGTITITSPLGPTLEYSLNGTDWLSDPVFSGLTPDADYTVYVRDISVDPTCVSSADFTVDPVPGAPDTPEADITQPSCAEPTGTITITSPLGPSLEYSLNSVDWVSTIVFSDLTADAVYTIYVRDTSVDPTCVSSADFTIDPVPGAPETPEADITQPSCAEPTGTITITSPLGSTLEYSLNGTDWLNDPVFSGLTPDADYTIYVRDTAVDPTCVSSADFTIDPVPDAPDTPEADITQPSCAEPTGTITITTPLGATIEYSLNGTDWLSDPVFSGLTPDAVYTVYVRDNSVDPTCVSSADFTIDPVPGAPETPLADITQPSCAEPTGTITITSPLGSTLEYSLNGTDWLSAPVFSGLTPDADYTVYVRDISVDPTCVSSADFTIDPVPVAPDTPEADITQPSCAEPTGTITITSPLGPTLEYSLNGTDWLSDPVFSGLTPDADYTVYVRDISVDPTCVSSADFTVDPVPGAPDTPEADITQPSCAEPTGTITITSPLGPSLEYSLNSVDWVSTIVFSDLTADAVYTIYVRDTSVDTTCMSSANFTIDPAPEIPGEISGDSLLCQGESIILSCVPTGGLWSSEDTSIAIVDEISGLVSGISEGSVEIKYTLNSGCASLFKINVNPLPGQAGIISGPTTFTPGTSGIEYSIPLIPHADNYVWSYSGTGVVIHGTGASVIIDFLESATEGLLSVKGQNECGFGEESFIELSLHTRTLNISSLMIEGLYDGSGTMRQAWGELAPQWPEGIADMITIELHRADDYSIIEYSAANTPLSVTGDASIVIPASYNGSYYITIRHRNSLETTSSVPISFTGNVINKSFGSPSEVYGANLNISDDGWYMIYGGDVNQDGVIDTRDFIGVENDSYNYVSDYIDTDVDGNGIVDTRDFIIIYNNNYNYVEVSLPF